MSRRQVLNWERIRERFLREEKGRARQAREEKSPKVTLANGAKIAGVDLAFATMDEIRGVGGPLKQYDLPWFYGAENPSSTSPSVLTTEDIRKAYDLLSSPPVLIKTNEPNYQMSPLSRQIVDQERNNRVAEIVNMANAGMISAGQATDYTQRVLGEMESERFGTFYRYDTSKDFGDPAATYSPMTNIVASIGASPPLPEPFPILPETPLRRNFEEGEVTFPIRPYPSRPIVLTEG